MILLSLALLTGCGVNTDESETSQTKETPEDFLEDYLKDMKAEADAMYTDREVYGVAGWDNEAVRNSPLYQFAMAIPKGAELHTHEMTLLPFDRFIEVIRNRAWIVLDEDDNHGKLYAQNNPNRPENAVNLDEALSSGLISMGALRDTITLSGTEKEDGLWDGLTFGFTSISGLSIDNELMEQIYEESFRYAVEIGLDLVELRISRKKDEASTAAYLENIRNAYYAVRKEYPDFRVRIIGTAGKSLRYSIDDSTEGLQMFIHLSKTILDEFDPDHPEQFIIGLDLVNEEDTGRLLDDYVDYLVSDEVRDSGLKLFLHCGESLRLNNKSVNDAYIANTYRAGHAFNLYRDPSLMFIFKESHITIEVCPISNLSLGYVHDLRLHPAYYYKIEKVPFVVCSDDGLFMTARPLVDDYYSAILCWDFSMNEIKEMCERSIEDSGLSDEETEKLLAVWHKKWDAFCEDQLNRLRQSEQ